MSDCHLDNSSKHSQGNTPDSGHSHTHSLSHSHSHSDPSHSNPGHSDHSHSDHSHSDHSHSHSESLGLFGHSHSHSHQHNELLSKGFFSNPAVRITWIGLLVNVLMAGSKGLGGVAFHSQALIADAIHSVSDMVADLLTLATVKFSQKEGSFSKYPLGYGKFETLGTLMVSGVLLFAGVSVGWSSLLQILQYTVPPNIYEYLLMFQLHSHSHIPLDSVSTGHSHSHGDLVEASPRVPNINAAWLALGSIGVKEILFRKTLQVAKESNSSVLVANAWHHRIDSLTAGVAFVSVTTGVFFGVSWVDAVGGLIVSLLIINVGIGTFSSALVELLDRGEEKGSETYSRIESLVQESLETVSRAIDQELHLEDLSCMAAGPRSNLILKVSVKENLPLDKICDLEHRLAMELKKKDHYIGKVFIEYMLKVDGSK